MFSLLHYGFVANTIVNRRYPSMAANDMDSVMVFGFLTGILTILFWMHRDQSRSAMAAFGICLMALAAFVCVQNAWPVALVLAVWAGDALVKSRRVERKPKGRARHNARNLFGATQSWESESRMERLFGSK